MALQFPPALATARVGRALSRAHNPFAGSADAPVSPVPLDEDLLDPLGNLRQVCQQLTLLEDHLNIPSKRCPDCVMKHFLRIEALLVEALDLNPDPETAFRVWEGLRFVRALAGAWTDGESPTKVAAGLRELRKAWMPVCFAVGLPLRAREAS